MKSSIVDVVGLHKSFGGQQVLRDVNWTIGQGQVVGLLGRNGAGKSTLLACLLGLREADAGAATLFGEPVPGLSDAVRAEIGYVPQKSDLFDWLTPVQMLDYFKVLYPRWNAEKVDGLMRRWGLDGAAARQRIGQLSGGEKQRLSIIRALAHQPKLLVLDEPVASLDPVGRRDFLRELMGDVIERDTTVIFSTHILSDLERVAVDVAFLQGGAITLQAPLDELLGSAHRITGTGAALAGLRLGDELRRRQDGAGGASIVARLSAQEEQALRAADGLRVEALNLEELFVEVTK
nr:ABC transporter ATP-binding protein [uncultured Duganella sp.]